MRQFISITIGDKCGAAALEFSLVLPLLLLMAFGIVDFGRAFQVKTTLNYAIHAAARCYAVAYRDPTLPCYGTTAAERAAAALSYAQSIATGLTAPTSTFTVTTTSGSCSGVLVQATLPFNLFPGVPPKGEAHSGIPNSVQLGSIACYPT